MTINKLMTKTMILEKTRTDIYLGGEDTEHIDSFKHEGNTMLYYRGYGTLKKV